MLFVFFREKWPVNLLLVCMLLLIFSKARAQYFNLEQSQKNVTIPFRLVRNMIIIKLKINDQGPFNFVLDTGVGLMIITEPKLVDSIKLSSKIVIKIPGLGDNEDNEAYLTPTLNIGIPGLESHDITAAILKTDRFNLSGFAGVPVDGLLGYEFFSNLAVKINFRDSTVTVCKPKDLRHLGKMTRIPISIEQRKPYLQAGIIFSNGEKVDSKLIIDIGAGHPVSIENMVKDGEVPKKSISASLGIGLNGPIEGYLSRVTEVDIGKYKLMDVIASFPNENNRHLSSYVARDGNLGVGILKKFDVIFDYPDNLLYLRPGAFFKEPFEHDMSGLEYYTTNDFRHVIVSRVEPGSAADDIGMEKGDEIMSVNFRPVAQMTLEDLDEIFESRNNRSIFLEIYHDKKYDYVILTLKRRI
jgi:hypothetical protein